MHAIKAIIGLGNPGPRYQKTRHNIGFMVLDALAEYYQAIWHKKNELMLEAVIKPADTEILLIKPLTSMNLSGKVISYLQKQGIKAENILVVHDELELPFGTVKTKTGGSAKGHNGLKSIIEYTGPYFHRLRVGIGRPANRENVPDYVLSPFSRGEDVEQVIATAQLALQSFL